MDASMTDPCPRMLRLKQPSLSQPRESAPHCEESTTMTPAVRHHHSSTQQSSTQQSGRSAFTNLQDDAGGLVEVHHLFDDWLKELPVT